jgi:hypothetical protein
VSAFQVLERLILHDPGARGVAALALPGSLESACRTLAAAKRVGVVTGFYIPSAGACETDGPLGAFHLAAALGCFCQVVVCTDRWCLPVVRSLSPDATIDADMLADCDVLVAVERPGRAEDGKYYSMRGDDLSPWTAPLDNAFLNRKAGTVSIGVGDGGNEIGMGAVRDVVRREIPIGSLIASVVPADHLVACGVSNWGAWALATGVSLLRGEDLLPSAERAFDDLQKLVADGAVDGVTGRNEPTVDGLAWGEHERMLNKMLRLLSSSL